MAAPYLGLVLLLLCNVPLELLHRLQSLPNVPVHLQATLQNLGGVLYMKTKSLYSAGILCSA